MNASFRSAIGSPWTEMEPVRVGRVPPGKGTPDVFVIAEKNDKPVLRVDVYDLAPDRSAFAEGIGWKPWIVIGIGRHLYLVPRLQPALAKKVSDILTAAPDDAIHGSVVTPSVKKFLKEGYRGLMKPISRENQRFQDKTIASVVFKTLNSAAQRSGIAALSASRYLPARGRLRVVRSGPTGWPSAVACVAASAISAKAAITALGSP